MQRRILLVEHDRRAALTLADTIARARLAEVELRIRHLQSLQAELQAMIGRGCRQRVSKCRVIEGLIGSPA